MKNKKGFTLIELLAVIVILGLLMAIAIPSVTKYITESRKKTVVSTIGNYITAMVNEVNDLTYTFTGNNTIYAVPIECIALERGGTNPFGAWHQASNAYWAYVLVQYDDETSSYTYGYTFKDSAGYGLYPTSQAKLNESGKQIQTGLSLTRPKEGKVTNIAAVSNWSGFNVDGTTDLVVLTAESEGNAGNGISTCTLQQKGDNYATVEQEKNNQAGNNNNDKENKEDEVVEIDELAGTWVFTMEGSQWFGGFVPSPYSPKGYSINFICNGVEYTTMSLGFSDTYESVPYIMYGTYGPDGDGVVVFEWNDGWTSDEYRTITITSKASEVDNLDMWLRMLEANAEKQ